MVHRCLTHMRRRKSPCLLLAASMAGNLAATAAPAYTVSFDAATYADEIQRHQAQELEQQRVRAGQRPDVLSGTESSSTDMDEWALPDETPCFPLLTIRWEGYSPPENIQKVAQSAIGKCVGLQGLNVLQQHLTMRLVESGLITAWVRVPEQSLAQGSLTLHYGAGRISSVRSEHAPGWWRTVLPSRPGDELNQRDLDQALENIQRLKGQSDARIDIAPGTEPGASDILLQPGSGKRWHAYVGGDNAGLKAMGSKRLNAGLTLDSPLFLYDQFSVSWNSNAALRNHDNNTRAASAYYSVPFGYWTIFASAGHSRYRQTVSGFEAPIVYGGTTQQVDAGVSVVPYRGSRNKGTIVAKVLRKRVGGTLNGIDIEVQRRDIMGYELGYQHRHYAGRTVVEAGAGLRGTVPQYSKQPGYVYGDAGWNGRTTILAVNAGAYMPFAVAQQQMTYQFNWQFQHAKTRIVPADYFTIGDRYTVRGFDGQMTLAAEDGWSLRNDLAWNLSTFGQQLYTGVDAGRVSGPSAQYLSGRTLVGAVAGLRGRISVPYIDTSYDISLGWPLKKPDVFPTSSVVFAAAMMFEF